jgi:hypothetical protein
MLESLGSIFSWLAWRFRGRAALELEVVALRHQLAVLRRQRPGRPRLTSFDRVFWAWLYKTWPECLNAMVLVKPATVVQWHRQGFPWSAKIQGRSRSIGHEGVLVVKSVQYGVRHHSTCAVETMPLGLERHREIHNLIGKAGPQRRVWSAAIVMR